MTETTRRNWKEQMLAFFRKVDSSANPPADFNYAVSSAFGKMIQAYDESNTIHVGPGDYLQAAIDAAVAGGATSGKRWTINYSDNVDVSTVIRDTHTGYLKTTGGDIAYGVDLVNTSRPALALPDDNVYVSANPVAVNTDDGFEEWITEESGVVLSEVATDSGGSGGDNWHAGTGGEGISTTSGTRAFVGKEAIRIQAPSGSYTGSFGHTKAANFTDGIDISGTNYVSFWIYPAQAFPSGVLQFGVSAATDFSNPVYLDLTIPQLATNTWSRVVLPLDTDIKAVLVKSLGFTATGMASSAVIIFDRIKVHVLGDTIVEVIPTTSGKPTSYPVLAQLTPAGYASRNGVTMTHCVFPYALGTNDGTYQFMDNDDLREVTNRFGNSVELHGYNDNDVEPTTMEDWLESTIGLKERMETLEGSTDLAYPAALGLKITGTKEHGTAYAINTSINSVARTIGVYAQLIKRYLKWSMNYYGYAAPSTPFFAMNRYNQTVESYYPAAGTDNVSCVVTLHHIAAAEVAPYTVSYTYFKQLVDTIKADTIANRSVSLTLSSFFKSKIAQATTWANLPGGNFAGTVSPLRYSGTLSANGGVSGGKCLEIGDNAATAHTDVSFNVNEFVPGESTCLWCQVKGDTETPLEISVVYYDGNTPTTAKKLFSLNPPSTFTDVFIRVTPPVWASRYKLVFRKAATTANGQIFIDDIKYLERA